MATANYHVAFELQLDQLSMCFVLLILGVGSLIHLYSVGYMADDPRRRRFFAYLNLFVAAMLLLVLAGDYLLLFVGWEGVGLASYLLIGFWQHKPSAATAAKKAFVVNRVGDIGLSLAIMALIFEFGSSSFAVVDAGADKLGTTGATIIGLLLLLGACGKSAQWPLQSWLLDAMEGPTPVSALIHAATMVTAGVYLIARSSAIFEQTQAARTVVMIVGCITLLFGAIIGCAKDDIKKALAGSTMSQIGYMVLAAGLGPVGYGFAILHLVTHGFFKANLFLGAGSVMHAMDDDVNMRHYGALRKALPITFVTFACGYLAIIGIPPFAGFFSKDKIIEAAFATNWVAGLAALIGAGVTAFYMTRVMLMTFVGEKRWREGVHPHEAPATMTIPLVVLGFLSVVGGFSLSTSAAGSRNSSSRWSGCEEPDQFPVATWVLTVITLLVVLAGVAVSWLLFGRPSIPETAPAGNAITHAARADLYGDLVNEKALMAARGRAHRGHPAGRPQRGRRHRDGGRRHGRRAVVGVPPDAERLRPDLRADDVRRCRSGHPVARLGEDCRERLSLVDRHRGTAAAGRRGPRTAAAKRPSVSASSWPSRCRSSRSCWRRSWAFATSPAAGASSSRTSPGSSRSACTTRSASTASASCWS